MKKLFIYSLLSLTFMILSPSIVAADVIPPNSHPLDRCVKIVNLDEFTDIYLIGYITGPMIKGYEAYIYKKDECLSMGYKFNQLKVLAAKKSYIDFIGVNNLQVEKVQIPGECPGGCYSEELSDKNVFVSDEKIYPYGGYTDQGNPLIKETTGYSIAGYSNGKLILYKSKQTSEYNNGTPKKVDTFNYPPGLTPASSPELTKRRFWQSIICFFRGLFGRSCQQY